MKKFEVRSLLALLLAAVMVFAMVACTGTDDTLPPDETTEPAETDPVETDPVETDPVETDPVETDPVETDPPETDPAETDPVETEPPVTEPVETEPPTTEPPATGCEHEYGTGKKVNATCRAEGYTEYTCKKCGETKKEDVVSKVDHLYTYTVLTDPRCTTGGEIADKCTFCGETTNVQSIPALGCEYKAEIVSTASPTHHTAEVTACIRCGNIASAKGVEEHKFKYVENSRVEDSATAAGFVTYGFEIYACDCGYQFKVSSNHAEGHYYEYDSATGKYACDCGASNGDVEPAYNGNENAGPEIFAQG